jgi:hypothetical protein
MPNFEFCQSKGGVETRILCYAAALLLICGSLILEVAGENPPPSRTDVETIVFLRHGEKPSGGLGQLTCQGLNRALALPSVLISKFGKADYVFAPDPEGKVTEGGLRQFAYIRPLATIEPTAIRLGLPVCTDFRFKDIASLQNELTKQQYNTTKHSYSSLGSTTSWLEWPETSLVPLAGIRRTFLNGPMMTTTISTSFGSATRERRK